MKVDFERMKKQLDSSLNDVEDIVDKSDNGYSQCDINLLDAKEIEKLAETFLDLWSLLRTFSILEEDK